MLRLQTPLPDGYTTSTEEDLARRIAAAKDVLGSDVIILGHHYQRDEVMRWADARGDSFGLSRTAASTTEARYVVFCGVHFMAESADILTSGDQQVILPDLNAGCSMADMADLDSVEEAWEAIAAITDIETVVPITYMNSSAALKAFVGRNGGAVCTSSNARKVISWALEKHGGPAGHTKLLFFPDQHLGRNTAYAMGYPLDRMVVWDPREELGGNDPQSLRDADFVLWKGHCSVHQLFRPEHVDQVRAKYPDMKVIVHPECRWEVVQKADMAGSTAYIVKTIEAAPPGSQWAVGTEVHLINRLAHQHPEQKIIVLSDCQCLCTTMYRIDLPHLCWVLENLVEGKVVNEIKVDADTRKWALVALDRMLAIKGTGNPIGKKQPAATTVD